MKVGVQGSGAVGTGTIPENVLLVSLLSVTRPVESRVTVTGLPALAKNTAPPALAGNPLTVCVAPLTLTTKLLEAAAPMLSKKTRTPITLPGEKQPITSNSIFTVSIARSGRSSV